MRAAAEEEAALRRQLRMELREACMKRGSTLKDSTLSALLLLPPHGSERPPARLLQ